MHQAGNKKQLKNANPKITEHFTRSASVKNSHVAKEAKEKEFGNKKDDEVFDL